MNKWIIVSFASLTLVSLFGMYVGNHIAQGIICNYVFMTPYLLPVVYILGFFLGYSIPQLISKRDPKNLINLFKGDEKIAVEVAIQCGIQTDVAKKIGKVRAHRVIRNLEITGILEKEKFGRTYKLKLGKKLQKLI